ncbi:MAG: D-aminopeptidase [Acetobacteraceae bacterium]|nr:D-aminopeptidase [Acetobacteraceae bacterium]
MAAMSISLEHVAAELPARYPGPGGAVAVLREGAVVLRHAWGFANAERRLAFTPATLFRICSITKQFVCALLLDRVPDPTALEPGLRRRLPKLSARTPSALHLAHNQSGLRDYWAVAMLHGSPVEAPFGDDEAARVIGGTRSLQFDPGTRYSYTNQNFRLLSELLEESEGRTLAELLRRHVFDRAGMPSALLAADTRALAGGTEGYEGSQAAGFRAAENRVFWTGDAGIAASLDDMIAWERHIDATRDDPASLYRRLSAPVAFANGSPAAYGFGLGRATEFGRAVTGHGGALRGWRSHRLHVAEERISVVVLFNHMGDTQAAALDLLAAALGEARGATELEPRKSLLCGAYLDPETGLAARVDEAGPGRLRLRFGHSPDRLEIRPDGSAGNARTTLRRTAGGVWMDRPAENQSGLLLPNEGPPPADAAGRYRCDELDAELTIADAGGALYGAFSGFLGRGRMELLEPAGRDVWALPMPRALDHTPPGDWTLAARREGGRVAAIEVGCWLARRLTYRRIG